MASFDLRWRLTLTRYLWLCSLVLLSAGAATLLMAKPPAITAHGTDLPKGNLNKEDEQAIRSARARWNTAIAARDVEAVAKLFDADVHVTSGTGTTSGHKECVERLRNLLESRPDMKYERTPTRIEGHEEYQLAYEAGTWVERWTNKEDRRMTDLRGEYMVMWRKVSGVWLTKAEIYVPASCTGSSYCKPRSRS